MGVYTVTALADAWHCSPDAVYDLLRGRRLHGFKVGGVWRITEEAKAEFETAPVAYTPKQIRRITKIHN